MKSKGFSLFNVCLIACIILGVLSGCSACSKDEATNVAIDAGDYAEIEQFDHTKLQIVQASPVGELKSSLAKREVTLVFNHPMKALSALDEVTSGSFKISPFVPGKFRWYGSRICSFTPENGWKFGQSYTVSVPKGTSSLNGKVLEKKYSFTFKLEVPAMNAYISRRHYSPDDTINYDQSFTIRFSHPINKEIIGEYISLTENGNLRSYTISDYVSNNRVYNDRVILTPSTEFDRGSEVKVSVNKGLVALNGAARFYKTVAQSFQTHGPLSVELSDKPKFFEDLYYTYISFNNQIDANEARKRIVISPSVSWKGGTPGKRNTISLSSWDFKPGMNYKITVGKVAPDSEEGLDPTISDVYGNELETAKSFTLKVPDYRPYYHLEEGYNSVLEAKEKPYFPVQVSNMSQMRVRVADVKVNDIAKDLERDYSELSHNLAYTSAKKWNTGLSSNERGRVGFDLSPYLSSDKTGWKAVEFTGDTLDYDGEKKTTTRFQLVQSTDLGISVKEGFNSSMVWVNSLKTGEGVSGAELTFYNGSAVVGKATTDADGYCEIANPAEEPHQKGFYVVSYQGKDRAFVTGRDHQLPMYYVNDNYDENGFRPKLIGQIIFDRKLYRPADSVFFKGVLTVRENGELRALSNETVDMEIFDSQGNSRVKTSIKSSAEGGVWSEFPIPKDAPLGHYQVRFSYSGIEHSYVNDTFQVEEFRPVSFAVAVDGLKDAQYGESQLVTVDGQYLFGAPMKGAPMSYSIYRTKRRAYIDNYSDFTFGNGDIWRRYYSSDTGYYSGGKGSLGSDGRYDFTLTPKALSANEKIYPSSILFSSPETLQLSDMYDMRLEATVSDVDKKSVTKSKSVRIYPGKSIFGIRPLDRYHSNKDNFEFDLVALSKEGKASGDVPSEVYILYHNYKSQVSLGSGNSLNTNVVLRKQLIKKADITLSSKPKRYSIKVSKSGSFDIIVKEKKGLSYSRESFYAWGGKTSWFDSGDSSVTLIPDKREYKPGDTAKILVQAPFKECTAIVTLEREKIFWQKSVKITDSSIPIEIPMKDEYLPNVYMSVMLIRPRIEAPEGLSKDDADEFEEYDMGAPTFKAGSVKLSVSNKSKRLNFSMKQDKEKYFPGDEMTVTFETEPHAEIALASADLAVLNLIDYSYADPVNKFYQNWPDSVRILDNRRYIIHQYKNTTKGDSPGGEGKGDELEGSGGFNAQNEDGARKDIRYTAYWNPVIKADGKGKAYATFKLPENLSTFRLMALAAKSGKFASSKREFKIRKDIVVRKNLPRFIRPGDTLYLGGVVTNQTDVTGLFEFTIESNLLHGMKHKALLTLTPGESKEVSFPFTLDMQKYAMIKEAIAKGAAEKDKELQKAQSDDAIMVHGTISLEPKDAALFTKKGYDAKEISDKMVFDFPVREFHPAEAFTVTGFTNDKKEEFLKMPSKSYVVPDSGTLKLSLSPTILTGLENGFNFYDSNPYFCLEQRASAFLLAMSSGKLLKEFKNRPPKGYNFRNIEKLFLKELGEFQNADGGFRAWKDSSYRESNPYLTAYVLYVMVEAKRKGHKVDKEILKKAGEYIDSYLREPAKDTYSYVLETFALMHYVRAREGRYNSGLASFLLSNEEKLSMRARAYLAMGIAIKKKPSNGDVKRIYRDIINRIQITTRKVSFGEVEYGFARAYYRNSSTASVVLRLMMMVDSKNELIPQVASYIVSDRAVWSDSHGTGLAAIALHDYYEQYEKKGKNQFTALVRLNSKEIFKTKLNIKKPGLIDKSISFADLHNYIIPGATKPLVFESSANSRLYYTASLLYAPAKLSSKARDEGIELKREYYDLASGKKINDFSLFKRGKMYGCKLTLVVGKPCYNFVLVDPLSSTMEIVNTAFKTEGTISGIKESSSNNSEGYWWAHSDRLTEYRDDKVVITQSYLSPGYHTFSYVMRPVMKGEALLPPAEASLMYEPEVFGRSSSSNVSVK